MMKELNCVSLFSGGGIGETYLSDLGINVVVANELIEKRANFYKFHNPDTEVIIGDIKYNLNRIISIGKENDSKLLIATPPCQGMSTLGKKDYDNDPRNYLIYYVFEIIEQIDFDFILIENVPKFLNLFMPYEGRMLTTIEVIKHKFSSNYCIEYDTLNAMYYGVPQSRPRAIIRMYKKDKKWLLPEKKPIITLRESIGHLPSLESGESSDIKFHKAMKHSKMHQLVMAHTPEGKSAISNDIYYPKKKDGSRVKGFHNTYKRMKWDEPCPTRALNNGAISGHNNVHPGRLLDDGTWSDARALTLHELFIVSSLPKDWIIPEWASENFIRQIIGEGVPPLFIREILNGIERG